MPAIVNLQLRGIDVFRTFHIEETFCLLVLLVEKLESPSLRGITALESRIKPPRSKREREASPRTSFSRLLRCVPGVLQDAADCLANHIKNLPALQRAFEADTPFPKIQLSGAQSLGKTRLKRLRTYLLEEQPETQTQEKARLQMLLQLFVQTGICIDICGGSSLQRAAAKFAWDSD